MTDFRCSLRRAFFFLIHIALSLRNAKSDQKKKKKLNLQFPLVSRQISPHMHCTLVHTPEKRVYFTDFASLTKFTKCLGMFGRGILTDLSSTLSPTLHHPYSTPLPSPKKADRRPLKAAKAPKTSFLEVLGRDRVHTSITVLKKQKKLWVELFF